MPEKKESVKKVTAKKDDNPFKSSLNPKSRKDNPFIEAKYMKINRSIKSSVRDSTSFLQEIENSDMLLEDEEESIEELELEIPA